MKARILGAVAALCSRQSALAQSPKGATYITAEQVKTVNALPGVDRQIVNVDVGNTNLAVGVDSSRQDRRAAGRWCRSGGPAAAAPAHAARAVWRERHGAAWIADRSLAPGQTETYIIISGSGTLVTGGKVVNGRKSAPDSQVTKVLNGPSCSGSIVGDDVVKRVVNVGDIIIIPAGMPHGWADIGDHVDYLSVRPDPQRTIPELYTNPVLKK